MPERKRFFLIDVFPKSKVFADKVFGKGKEGHGKPLIGRVKVMY